MTDALSRTTDYSYDDFNRLKKIKYPEAIVGAGRLEESVTYDLAGNLTTKTDQAGRVTTFSYDNANRLTSTIDAAQKTTTYEYNARSQMTAVIDVINQRYEFVYDALGHRTQEKKGTATMSFLYDAVGNRTQRTDYNSAVTDYVYDALNRQTTISYPDSTSATYGYDALSRLTTATNPTGTVTVENNSRFGQELTMQHQCVCLGRHTSLFTSLPSTKTSTTSEVGTELLDELPADQFKVSSLSIPKASLEDAEWEISLTGPTEQHQPVTVRMKGLKPQEVRLDD